MARRSDNTAAARDLRRRMTPAEERLWEAIRGGRRDGLKIRRQHAVGPYVVDFAVPSVRLCIELDGPVHDDQAEADAARTENLDSAGYRVLRFPNERVFSDLDGVIAEIIAAAAQERLPVAP
jgi:very-short-patch-repair endonuclease